MAIEIQTVGSESQLQDFLRLPRALYRGDPAMVFPLQRMARQLVDADAHPFYEHATRELFVAYQDGVPVGRIAAIKDQLQQEYQQNRCGSFGFFETIDNQEVAAGLVQAAESWLSDQGCDRMLGPVSPSMKGEFGVLVQGHENPPAIMTD